MPAFDQPVLLQKSYPEEMTGQVDSVKLYAPRYSM